MVAGSRRPGALDDGVYTGAGVQAAGHVDAVVPDERPQDLGVLGEVVLRERGHHAARVRKEDREADVVTDLE